MLNHSLKTMATSKKVFVSLAFFVILFGLSQAFGSFDCCIKFNKRKVDINKVDGYYHQKSTQVCDIDAVVFLVRTSPCSNATIRMCADPKQNWVQERIKALNKRTLKSKQRRLKKLKKICKRLEKELM
ncbi:C-C motif chemokine 20-like [Pyxicephalus adspersus]|uniref:C-C motif chemokine 20-like n=1 Tax=Pyxicephalus adspersus TaxID=30357 RepID=UPI003B5C2BE2